MKSAKHLILIGVMALVATAEIPSSAQSQNIQAQISGGSGSGKCTIEVVVQGVAEVQIRGNQGNLRTLSGNPAQWRRLDCNQPLPGNPSNFKFSGVDGHGRQSLSADPNSNNGVAVIRIENTTGGNEGYTADITWNGGNNNSNGNWGSGNSNDNWGAGNGNGNGNGNANGNWNGQSQNIQARITGGGGNGKCTFEVVVSGPGEVRIRGAQGNLQSLSGGQAQWRRLDCNQPLPQQPVNFRFSGVDGHGQQSLVQDPGANNGVAVIRIDNANRNNEGYTGDITWTGGNNNWGNNQNNYPDNGGGYWNSGGTSSAVQACQGLITDRVQRDHRNARNIQALPDNVRVSRRSNDLSNIQGDGLYQAKNGNSRRFTYGCVYDARSGQITESTYQQQ